MRPSTLPTITLAGTLVGVLTGLTGCSGNTTTMQLLAVRSTPDGAACTVARGGTVLGTVDATPGSMPVAFSDKDLTVTCNKDGWRPSSTTVKAIYQGIGLGQLISGGAAAVVEDAVKSTDFRYDAAGATVTLNPQ